MSEENAPTPGRTPNTADDAAAASATTAPAGHEVPQTFASPASTTQQPAAPAHGAQTSGGFVPPIPSQTPTGAAFGVGAHPGAHAAGSAHAAPVSGDADATSPIGEAAPVTPISTKERKPFGAGKVAAVIVAAALVGGAAGLGGSYLGSTMWQQPVSSSAEGPGTVTVNNPDDVNEATAVASKVLPSVVTIEVAGSSESGSGSGVILSEDGYVLTNTHVVTLGGAAADPTIRVTTSDGHIYAATIVGTDPIYDLAVIKLTDAEGLTPIEFADSSELNVGATAVAVGAPLGLANSVTTGIISSLNRSIEIASSALPDSAEQDTPEGEGEGEQGGPFQFDIPGLEQQQATASESISIAVIQTDAAINPGNSGGALVDGEGKLIGINVAIATASSSEESGSIGVGFAIPSNVAERIADELIENGEATHGLLGASVSDAAGAADADIAGAYIAAVTDGGAAQGADLREGDIVTEFNGAPISSASDLTAQVRAAAAGSTATLTYVRDGKTYEIEVELGELAL
ncbi:S1C family serine protease [Microbacterium sp. CIAB417]|uniref:S1C family serine protease n=1 Tax=Microbacterium sp. CIAB417 TaxID=2860287 RepID=UPI001FACD3E3|nr:trypsin-like peptidase domain-containing protein [Microbacterium sp. CIAB417]